MVVGYEMGRLQFGLLNLEGQLCRRLMRGALFLGDSIVSRLFGTVRLTTWIP